MKKIIAITMLAACVAGTAAYGQGYLILQSPANSQIFDGFTTPGAATRTTAVDVALFWAVNSTANPMPIASTPTTGNSQTTEPYTVSQAWSALLGSSFQLASQSTTTPAGNVITATSTKGAINYLGGQGFGITGTTASQSVALLEVSWQSSLGATPAAAAAAGSAIGWTYLSSYTLAASAVDLSISSPTFGNFGTFVPAAPVPEPGTMALAALGGASLLLFRRKK